LNSICKDELLELKSVKTGGMYGGFNSLHTVKPTNGAAVRGCRCMENSAAAVPIEKPKFFDGLKRRFFIWILRTPFPDSICTASRHAATLRKVFESIYNILHKITFLW